MRNETQTDIWVHTIAQEADIDLEPQGSNLKVIEESLVTASKSGTGNKGYPDFTSLVKTNNDDFLLVIENKKSTAFHVKYDQDGVIDMTIDSIKNYAVNGALYYARHLVNDERVPFKKIFAIGISGGSKQHRITPIFIDESNQYVELDDVDTLINLNSQNIDKYYTNTVLNEETDIQKESSAIHNLAKRLHEDLRSYGNLSDRDKPLIVSGILLALRESEYGNFNVKNLTGDKQVLDGEKIFNAIESNLRRTNIQPATKRDKLLAQFSIFKTNSNINLINSELGTSPLRRFTFFLWQHIYRDIRFTQSHVDLLGNFYSEFMSYSGGDGQTLGIILTPAHITSLFTDLSNLTSNDVVFDPCAGTAGFLISSMHAMLDKTDDEHTRQNIKQKQLHGIELQDYMFTIATTNMILRGDGKSNLRNENFLKQNPSKIQMEIMPTVGMINPPYSMAKQSKDNEQYEINFIRHMLDCLVVGGRGLAIVPQSTMTGKTNIEKEIKRDLLKKHTLEGVITLNTNTFYGVGTNTCIAVFTAGIPHSYDKLVKFIDFKNDGYKVAKHIGLVETADAVDKREKLLNVWRDELDSLNEFCVKTTIEADDEWLHGFYYFNENPPLESDFEETVSDYLSFQLNMVLHDKGYLFDEVNSDD